MLRAQVERMTTEILQYKQRVAVNADPSKSVSKGANAGFGKPALNNLGDVNFQFEFPKFGVLPGPKKQLSMPQPISPQQKVQGTPARQSSKDSANSHNARQTTQNARFNDGLAKFSSMFSPSMTTSTASVSRTSLDSGNLSSFGGNTSSPSASSNSNNGPNSSCGTSPEPFTQSPTGFKPMEAMTTIGEEQQPASSTEQPFAQFSNVDVGNLNFDWVAQQNGGQFDPQLFGDYREPQDNILANPTFDDLFNDSLDADFFTPYNIATTPSGAKLNLIDEIDAKQNSVDEEFPKKESMNCNQIWYEDPPAPLSPVSTILTTITGRSYRRAPRRRTASLIWTAYVLNSQRRPSALAVAQSWVR